MDFLTTVLEQEDLDDIRNNKELTEMHINIFRCLMNKFSNFSFQSDRMWMDDLSRIIPVPKNTEYIQILFLPGHFVCCYYNTKNVYIYDSINRGKLTKELEICLKHLFPYIDLKTVKFPIVQNQNNGVDCAVFSIAFAVSLMYGIKPDEVRYNQKLMRPHLIKIFQRSIIEHFPQDPRFPMKTIIPLNEIIRRTTDITDLFAEFTLNEPTTISSVSQSKITSPFDHNAKNDKKKIKITIAERQNTNYTETCTKTTDQRNILSSLKTSTKTKKRKIILLQLNAIEKNTIISGDWLNDNHILFFHQMLTRCSDFKPIDTLLLQKPYNIVPLDDPKKTHLQVIHSGGNHWVCCYYDSRNIFVYDSYEGSYNMNLVSPDIDIKTFLEAVFPFYDIENKPIKFPQLAEYQSNGSDCGPFSIAIAVSILFGLDPCTFRCNELEMRKHLYNMFETNMIEHFPIKSTDRINHPSLEIMKKRRSAAYRQRLSRLSKTEMSQKQSINMSKTNEKNCTGNAEIFNNDIYLGCETSLNELKISTVQESKTTDLLDPLDNAKQEEKSSKFVYNNPRMNTLDQQLTLHNDQSQVKDKNKSTQNAENVQFIEQRLKIRLKNKNYYHNNKGDMKEKALQRYHNNSERQKKNQREMYRKNPEIKKQKQRQAYDKNKELKTNNQRQKYKKNSEIIKRKERQAYRKNPELKKEKERQAYQKNSELKKEKERQAYQKNSGLKKEKERQAYQKNPELKKEKERQAYQKNPELKINKVLKNYHNHIDVKRKRKRISYSVNIGLERKRQQKLRMKNSRIKQIYNKRYYESKKKKRPIKGHVRINYTYLYKKAYLLKKSPEVYIRRIACKLKGTSAKCRIESGYLYKWCTVGRNFYINEMKKALKKIKNTSNTALIRTDECKALNSNKTELIQALCGPSKHTPVSEDYFYESTYTNNTNLINNEECLILNEKGQVINILPLKTTKDGKVGNTWQCNESCRIQDETLEKYNKFLRIIENVTLKKAMTAKTVSQISNCSNKLSSTTKLGHPMICHINPVQCKSFMATVLSLAPHFPQLRYVKTNLYKFLSSYKNYSNIMKALIFTDVKFLENIAEHSKSKTSTYNPIDLVLDEDDIQAEYYGSFYALNERCLNLP